jgi:hypothetical protein
MPDKTLRIWQIAYIESRLAVDHGPAKILACRFAYNHGFEVDEIAAASGLPLWRVRQAILGEATKRTGDE